MAIITNSVYGDIHGSIGGLTFMMNGTRQIVRVKTKPKNVLNKLTLQSRTMFKQQTKSWASISSTLRNDYNTYAPIGYFNPKGHFPFPAVSGFTAYVGTQLLAKHAYGSLLGTSVFTSNNPVPVNPINSNNTPIAAAPLYVASSDFLDNLGGVSFWNFNSISINTVLGINFTLSCPPGITYQASDAWHDHNGLNTSFDFWLSSRISCLGARPKNFYRKHIGCTGWLGLPAGYLSGCNFVNVTSALPAFASGTRFIIRPGEIYKLSIIVLDEFGSANFCVSDDIVIS